MQRKSILPEAASSAGPVLLPAQAMVSVDRYILLGIFFAASLAVSANINDSTYLKQAVLLIGSLLLVSLWLSRGLRNREISLTGSSVQAVLAAYGLTS